MNSGTINVGTAQGKADGTNGTGLIGIKGNGRETTINNAQSGVINVYADNSPAFGGQTKRSSIMVKSTCCVIWDVIFMHRAPPYTERS